MIGICSKFQEFCFKKSSFYHKEDYFPKEKKKFQFICYGHSGFNKMKLYERKSTPVTNKKC